MTITHSHYVGLLVPHCSLTYGELPCHAQLDYADGGAPNNIDLNGAYAKRGAGLTAAADSKSVTGNFWIEKTDPLADSTIFAGTTTAGGTTLRFEIFWLTSGAIRFRGWSSAGTVVLNVATSALEAGNLYHVMYSFDLNNTSNRYLYVDGVSDLSVTTYTNTAMDFTLGDWSIGALPNGTSKFDGHVANFWFKPGLFIDLSVEANRELFRTTEGRPVDLGSAGQNPTGSSPLVFFHKNVNDGWADNDGTGGAFSISGGGSEVDAQFSTGSSKCFNSLGTCQDLANFDRSGDVFLYFGEDVSQQRSFVTDEGSVLFPFIRSIDFQSAIVSLGDDMGQRGSVTVKLRDARTNDYPISVFDSYRGERGYEALEFGTFWGRFRARNPYMRFTTLILFVVKKDGAEGDEEIESRVYTVESISGPDSATGEVTITAKDILKVADGDFAKAPLQSPGFLASDIVAADGSATISPSGAIDDYPSSGYACIGGNEVVAYTKSGGDGVTLDTRGDLGTVAADHSAQDRFQLVLRYDSQTPDTIIADLLQTYAGIDSSNIDEDTWAAEVLAYLGTVNTFTITEPTNVRDLVSEIILQIGGAIWWDDVNEQIRLQILRAIATDAERWNEDNTIANSLTVQEQESKRVTEVSVYFGQINPTLKVDETRNYSSVATVNDQDVEDLVGGKSIKTIFARGIAGGGRAVAERLAEKYLSRYVVPPRRFTLELMKYAGQRPQLGGGYLLGGGDLQNNYIDGPFQDADGRRVEVPIQVTRVNPVGFTFQVEAEEVLFSGTDGGGTDPTNHVVIFDVNRNNVNLRDVHDDIYAEAQSGDTVNCYINTGILIGSDSVDNPAFEVGTFNGGVTVNLFVNGRIQGKGGAGSGANNKTPLEPGEGGGTALYTRQAINLENTEIWGGGGGGGGAVGIAGFNSYRNGGGGGAGTQPGAGGVPTSAASLKRPGDPGTSEAGGAQSFSPTGGNGGGPGLAGQNSTGGSIQNSNGGAAGAAVDGTSFVTYNVTGDIRGGQVN